MREKSHKYDITQCALYKIKGSKQLKKVLCITEEEYKEGCFLLFSISER